MESKVLAEEIINLLESKKAQDIVLIDISKKVDFAELKKALKEKPELVLKWKQNLFTERLSNQLAGIKDGEKI